jgi:DNA primase
MAAFDPNCIDVNDYLDCLDIRNIEKATEKEVRFSCPYPAHVTGDKSPSAYMNLETTKFFCHSCKAKGDAITFAADILGVSPIVATRMLRQRYSRSGIDPDSRSMVEEIHKLRASHYVEPRKNRIYDESKLDAYFVNWFMEKTYLDLNLSIPSWNQYMFNRGFRSRTLYGWQFGYAEWCDRITLPIRDEHGQLVGIKARAYDDRKPKYLNLRDKENGIEPYLKNDVVFALDRVHPDEDHLIIVEGEFNAIKMHSYGYKNTVSLNGSYFGKRQIQLIKQAAERVTLFFDSDPAGFEATRAVAKELMPFMPVDVAPQHFGDPADMHPYTIRRCVTDTIPARRVLMGS